MSDPSSAVNRHHNQPPEPISDLELMLDPAIVRDQLDLNYEHHVTRLEELMAGVDRFFATVKKIGDDEQYARAADFVAQLDSLFDDVDADRKREVKPLDDARKVIQKKMKAEILDLLEGGASDIKKKMTIYAREKKAAEDARQAAEAKRLREEADAALAKAVESQRPSLFEEAAKVLAAAEAGPRKIPTVGRGIASSASLRARYAFELINLADVPREWLTLDLAKIQNAIDMGLRDAEAPGIPGGRIVDVSAVVVRRA